MADADEDVISTLSTHSPNPDNEDDDIEDETQDYRFLNAISTSRTTQSTLPKRGTKDFEPNPTRAQSSALDASREAMHNALSTIRVHPAGKSHNVGIYVGDRERVREERFRVQFDGEKEGVRCVVVCRFRSTHSRAMGKANRRGWTWLLPEEALYLLERGSLDIRWGHVGDVTDEEKGAGLQASGDIEDVEDLEDEEMDPEPADLPMSLQGAYATFIGRSGLTLERYLVFAGLKRSGYIVQRAPTFQDDLDGQTNGHTPTRAESDIVSAGTTSLISSQQQLQPSMQPTLVHHLLSWLINPRRGTPCPTLGPLLAPGLDRNYNDIFRALTLIPYHQTTNAISTSSESPELSQSRPKPPINIAFHLWKPSSTFRKSTPPPPSYFVSVVDARATLVPTSAQIGDLLDSMPFSPLDNEKEKRLEARIKHGKRSVILAVVDVGVVSYLRFAESESGSGKLYEEKAKRGGGGKKGGGWRGGGKKMGGKR